MSRPVSRFELRLVCDSALVCTQFWVMIKPGRLFFVKYRYVERLRLFKDNELFDRDCEHTLGCDVFSH